MRVTFTFLKRSPPYLYSRKSCYLVVLYDLKRAGDNETEAVNALPCVVEEVSWGTEQQLLDQAQAGCESLLIKDDEVKKSLCWKCG